MTWFILSLATAFFMASTAAFTKRYFSDLSSWEMGLIPFLYATPLCACTLLLIDTPPIRPGFWLTLTWVLPLTTVAIIMHFRAIHISPLSLTMPFLSFTPIFAIGTGWLILGEPLSMHGVLGILLIVFGGYVINLDSAKFGVLGPIKAIAREKGSMLMLVTAMLYGLCAVGGKKMILLSSPLFAAMTIFSLYGILLTALLIVTGKVAPKRLFEKPVLGMTAGVIVFCEMICHNLAISMVAAAYMIAIKRMAGIFSVLYGKIIFKERGIKYRIIGAVIMAAGAAFIGLWG